MEANTTAEEFVKQFRKNNPITEAESIEHWIAQHCIEFAKLKCKEMRDAIIQNVKVKLTSTSVGHDYEFTDTICLIDKSSILKAYDINNIK